MLGQATATHERIPYSWLLRLWGYPDIHSRQKWSITWPYLAQLPESGIRLLDAGCGVGHWALELAARRPEWFVTGVDVLEKSIQAAQTAGKRLGLSNVSFVHSNFLDFYPFEEFEVVLSIASAHYLVNSGNGKELFDKFSLWLKPGGALFLFGPRQIRDVPLMSFLPSLPRHDIFTRGDLQFLCHASGLQVELLVPCIGRFGTWAKQISCVAGGAYGLSIATYPLQLFLTLIDRSNGVDIDSPSSAWFLIARKRRA